MAVCVALASIFAAGAAAYPAEVSRFGEEGSDSGRFVLPGGIASSPDGSRVFVADTGNDRVEEFTAQGEFLRAWGWGVADGGEELQTCTAECFAGQSGNRAGQLNEPIGVAVGAAGTTVYVIDRAKGDGRIQAFAVGAEEVAYDGALPAGYGNSGAGEADLTYPLPFANDVAVDPAGRVYVADTTGGESRIFVFGTDRKLAKTIPVGSEPISALTIGPDGRIYIGYGRYSVAILGTEGEREEFETTAYTGITALAVRPGSGNILVEPDQGGAGSVLKEYGPSGGELAEIPLTGMSTKLGSFSPGAFGLAIDPTVQFVAGGSEPGVAFEQGAVYVVDRYGGRVLVFADRAPGKPRLPEVGADAAIEGANLRASIDPNGEETHVYFEYGTTPDYGSANPAPPGIDLEAGFKAENASTHLSGLQPGTTYHYAVVATNAEGTTTSADRTFTTFPTAAPFSLPDGRAWEQVSTEKGTNSVLPTGIAAAEGGGVSFVSRWNLPIAPGGSGYSTYLGLRGPEGWRTEATTPPSQIEASTLFVSPDLRYSVAGSNENLTGDAPPNVRNLFLRDNATGAETLMTPYRRPGSLYSSYGMVGASNDFSRIFVQDEAALTPDTPADGQTSLYEFSEGSLKNVGILPGASTPATSSVHASNSNRPANVVSADGSRVFFTAEPEPGTAEAVFARIDRSRTVEISASQAATPDSEAAQQSATFVGAAADGSAAFFTSSARLTDDAYTGTPGDREPNLYRYDLGSGKLIDLTVATDPADEELGAAVSNVVVADSGEAAYFVATGNLAPGGISGTPNLYRWSEGGGIQFVAALDQFDPLASRYASPTRITRTTADGSVFVFPSIKALDPAFPGAAFTEEVYRFSAATGSIACVSCSRFGSGQSPATVIAPDSVGADYGGNVLSTDGNRVFFQTAATLVTEDTNGRVDVYEWENGAQHLISSGSGNADSSLLDASPSGDDVFFVTIDRLTPSDQDGYADVYDARVGGGLPAPPAASPPCEGSGCRGSQEAAAGRASIGSRSFDGPPDKKAKHHRRKHRRHRRHAKHRKHKRSHGHPSVGKRG